MKRLFTYRLSGLWIVLLAVLLSSCGEVVVRVDDVPSNTPKGAPIFITGNFNYWDPGDSRYQLFMAEDSSWYVTLPKGWGEVEYKFTRGDWTTVETNECGYKIQNRAFEYLTADTVIQHIQSWSDLDPVDCPEVTLVLTDLPENTPDSAKIALAANINNWKPGSEEFVFEKDSSGKRVLKVPKPVDQQEVEFKITRGNLSQAEGDEFGFEMPSRKVKFGVKDTVYLKVSTWEDLAEKKSKQVTIVLDKLPKNTPKNSQIFLAGDFNNWYPRDKDFLFQKTADGKYAVQVPRKGDGIQFKVTRGDWSNVEVDAWGNEQENYKFQFGSEDTIHTWVEGWSDKLDKNKYYSIVIDQLPKSTPSGFNLYVAGSFNGWDPFDRSYRMRKNSRNKYAIGVPAKDRRIEFKFTRGGWPKVEGDRHGHLLDNRVWTRRKGYIVHNTILSWEDVFKTRYNKVTLVARNLPAGTPLDAQLYMPCNFNGWQAADPRYKFSKKNGIYSLTVPRKGDRLEYKITRGGWRAEEVNDRGESIQNRKFDFGSADTVFVDISRWKDNPNP